MSLPVRLPALGLGVLQLQQGLDRLRTLPSSVRVYLQGRRLTVSRHEAFPVRVIDTGASDFALSTHYMQVWFSGLTGLLKVKAGERGGGSERVGVGRAASRASLTCLVWGQGSGLCFSAEYPKGG